MQAVPVPQTEARAAPEVLAGEVCSEEMGLFLQSSAPVHPEKSSDRCTGASSAHDCAEASMDHCSKSRLSEGSSDARESRYAISTMAEGASNRTMEPKKAERKRGLNTLAFFDAAVIDP